MTTVRQIYETLQCMAPLELQMDFDNSGLLVGYLDLPVECALLALDVSDALIEEAIERQAQLIISHHPLIFHPLKSVTDQDPEGRRLLRLIESGIAVISMHTNLDIVDGGVNDVLLQLLGASCEGPLDEYGCGRIGLLEKPMALQDFLVLCRAALPAAGIRYVDAGRPVKRIAVMGGSGADSLARAATLGCDTYVTADVDYHEFQAALDLRLNLIDGDHFGTEQPVIPALCQRLCASYPTVSFIVSERHSAIIRFMK